MVWFRRGLAALLMGLWLSAAGAQDSEEREGGIIGTGIVGTITHLGSIHVNGQHIQIDGTMPVNGSVTALTAGGLRPGHTVAVIVTRDGNDWQAQHIRQVLPLVGPVSAIRGGDLTVLGTRIDARDLAPDIGVGDWVAISGLWQDDRVRASRIDRLPGPAPEARLSGTYLGPEATGGLTIGGSSITGLTPRHLQAGDLIRVHGQPTADGIRATRLETGLFDEAVGVVQVEGYFSAPRPGGLYTVLGSGLVAYTDRPDMIDQDARVIRCGQRGQLDAATGPDQTMQLLTVLGC